MLSINARNIRNLVDMYLAEYDVWIKRGELSRAAEVLELIDEALVEYVGVPDCPLVTSLIKH